MPFFIIFVVIPVLELIIFGMVSEHIGLLTALLLCLFTAVLGGALVKHQGLKTIRAMQESFNAGTIPLSAMFDGFCLVTAGGLLITPGFLTDVVGFLLLIPHFRGFLRLMIKRHTNWAIKDEFHGFTSHSSSYTNIDRDVIEGEFEDILKNPKT